jgi:KRAB domain-containing zinc finger protein
MESVQEPVLKTCESPVIVERERSRGKDLTMSQVNVDQNERIFKCEHEGCTSSFRTRSSLRDHQKVHSEERPFTCNYCPSSFKSSSNRSKHERGSHPAEFYKRKMEREADRNGETNESPLKKIKVESNVTLPKQEQITPISNSPPKRISFACRFCDRHFNKTENRDRHEATHKDFLAYDCGYCYKNFKSQELLKDHLKIHTEQTTFECTHPDCTESFNDRRSLREHKSTHDFEYVCKVESCGKIFSSPKALKSHKRKHYDNMIQCDICLQKFDKDNKLADHLRLHI